MKKLLFPVLCVLIASFSACRPVEPEYKSGNKHEPSGSDVNLGLSVNWANVNVGATAPEDYGDYFAWGEATSKSDYSWSSYKYWNVLSVTLTKYYSVDSKTLLESPDDVAHVKWGNNWRIPTDEEWNELRTKCTWTWSTQNGVSGYRISASNGNSIFLPAAGNRYFLRHHDKGTKGSYWSSSLSMTSSDEAYIVNFDSSNVNMGSNYRYSGLSVRPVRQVPDTFTITFVGANGEILQSVKVAEGVQPTYSSITPTKEDSAYIYEFSGWYPTIVAATTNATYTAQFIAIPKIISKDVEAINLGLSVKWANLNIGATVPEDYGVYLAWGELLPKSEYSWNTYKFGSSTTITKYCNRNNYGEVDNKTTLEPTDDAAHVNWGGSWRMPTRAEWIELRTKCTWTWTTLNGVKGYRVSATNGNSIFLPAAGYYDGMAIINTGTDGFYWSSSLYTSSPFDAHSIGFISDYICDINDYNDINNRFSRHFGHSIRPVCR